MRGVAHLRYAVLETLYQAKLNNECLGAAEIGRRAFIFREAGYAQKSGNDSIIWGVLNSLVKDKLITKCQRTTKRDGWELTDQAFHNRNQELNQIPEWGGPLRLIDICRTKQYNFCPGCLGPLPLRPDIDHIQATAAGGPDTPENKHLMCPNCNRSRGKKPLKKFLKEKIKNTDPRNSYQP